MKKLSHISIECFRRIEYVKYINCRRQSGHWLLHGNSFTGKGKQRDGFGHSRRLEYQLIIVFKISKTTRNTIFTTVK